MLKLLHKLLTNPEASVTWVITLLATTAAFSQIPRDVPPPGEGEPLAFNNWANIVTFILIPLFFLALYIWLRRRKRKE